MKTFALSLIAASLAWGCSASGQGVATDEVRNIGFHCSNGETLSVRFHNAEERAVLVRHGQEISLKQQPSGSGFIYSNGPNTIRGKGNALTVEIGRMVPLQCEAH